MFRISVSVATVMQQTIQIQRNLDRVLYHGLKSMHRAINTAWSTKRLSKCKFLSCVTSAGRYLRFTKRPTPRIFSLLVSQRNSKKCYSYFTPSLKMLRIHNLILVLMTTIELTLCGNSFSVIHAKQIGRRAFEKLQGT